MKKKDVTKVLLANQKKYRREKKSSDWLVSYARGFKNPAFETK